jgi:hypothetical protein
MSNYRERKAARTPRTRERPATPIGRLIDAAVRCGICGAPFNGCDCWVSCPCGWIYPRGAACRNPAHADAPAAGRGGDAEGGRDAD